jgi:hypothetical protein
LRLLQLLLGLLPGLVPLLQFLPELFDLLLLCRQGILERLHVRSGNRRFGRFGGPSGSGPGGSLRNQSRCE